MDHRVINRPVSMEVQHLLIPLSGWLHFEIRLITNHMINGFKFWALYHSVKWFFVRRSLETRQEWASIVDSLDKSVNCVSISSDSGHDHRTVLVFQLFWFSDALGSLGDSVFVDSSSIINLEGNIVNSISMLLMMGSELRISWVEWRSEGICDISILDDMGASVPVTGFQTFVSYKFEPESGGVI